jgi:hypothetical protein
MSLTAQIGSSDVAFKLTQKVVASLAEKFGFKFEDGWTTISTRTVENIQKRLKREKRRANPTSSIKHPRTSFSFFTQRQRPVSQAAHPSATFGELSRFVSEAWKALTPVQMAEFKALETADKTRYQTERTALLAATPVDASVEVSVEVVEPVKEKRAKTPKTPKTAEAVVPAATPAVPKAEKVKTPKAAKVAKEVAAPVSTPAVAESKPAKAAKAKKAEAAPEATVAPVVAAAPKASKAKAVKA